MQSPLTLIGTFEMFVLSSQSLFDDLLELFFLLKGLLSISYYNWDPQNMTIKRETRQFFLLHFFIFGLQPRKKYWPGGKWKCWNWPSDQIEDWQKVCQKSAAAKSRNLSAKTIRKIHALPDACTILSNGNIKYKYKYTQLQVQIKMKIQKADTAFPCNLFEKLMQSCKFSKISNRLS